MAKAHESRTSVLKVRMNESELNKLDTKCEASGLNRSKYVRQSLVGESDGVIDDVIVKSITSETVYRDLDYFSVLVEMLESKGLTLKNWAELIKDDARRVSGLPFDLAENECVHVLRSLVGCVSNISTHVVGDTSGLQVMHLSGSDLSDAFVNSDDGSLVAAVALVEYAHAVVKAHCDGGFDEMLFWNSMARVMVKSV